MNFKTLASKWEHFIYHYKFHALITAIALLLIGYLFFVFFQEKDSNPSPSQIDAPLHIIIFGDFNEDNLHTFQTKLDLLFPSWDSIHLDFLYANESVDNYQGLAQFYQNQVVIQDTTPDLYIFDELHYLKFFESGPFTNLQLTPFNIPLDRFIEIELNAVKTPSFKGIQLFDIHPFQWLDGYNPMLVVHENSANDDHVIQFIQQFIQ
ncbi:hypothetical protein [Alkalihalobacillus pseudalcaliphilus]|uniref:hypothetical protein n=1 Tax=Alkalihalobacillus pseudalcaliphilus TaxID=79884 RepID=UPI00064D75DD|nr:hypothetical protein [Alkalihalobacillus pseudalcaliphilus]KMK77035.1 hypothetical protein AB990_05630 [Alkalihalobacillus pseudalcaliphilus]